MNKLMHSDRPFVFVIFAVLVVRVHPVVLTSSFKLLSFCIYLCTKTVVLTLM